MYIIFSNKHLFNKLDIMNIYMYVALD